jgi:4-hydroxy-2-oxoheptanedioate aldolase
MHISNLKTRLANGEVIVGCLLAYNAPWLVEILGLAGYDFVTYDLEHEPLNVESVASLVRTADGVGLSSFVRLAAGDTVLPLLTLGVHGVQVPHVRDADHAEQIVDLVRFSPVGHRTYYSQTRSARYGIGIDEQTWVKNAEEQLLVIGMIEDIDVAEHLDDLLAVDAIDAYHIGYVDFAQSMGWPPRDRLDDEIRTVVQRCRAAGKYVAVGTVTPWGLDNVGQWVAEGVQIVNVASGYLMTESVTRFLKDVEEQIPEAQRPRKHTSVSSTPYLTHGDGNAPAPSVT